jgi:hypothetical protein
MRLDHALNRIGVEIVRQHSPDKKSATLMLRVPTKAVNVWANVLQEFLLAAEEQPEAALRWTVDVSRVYFLDKESKVLRYLWRVVLGGNVAGAAEILGLAVIRTLSDTVEVTSQPLVGRVHTAPGSTKGAHDAGVAAGVIAKHFTPGGTS